MAITAAGIAKTPAEGVAMAQDVQRSGKAGTVLSKWVALSQSCKLAEGKQ